MDITQQRLRNQKLVASDLRTPLEIVSWLGVVQSQDYAGAKWALALRAPGLRDADVERACDDGVILRTHILRPTWHFVAPEDLRWMQQLAGPRLKTANSHYCRKSGLDAKTLAKSRKIIEGALRNRNYLTRTALRDVLARNGINGDTLHLAYLIMDCEIDHVICSGPRQGKQSTYALVDERAPKQRRLAGDEALAELTRRYFTSHGPATVHDFAWWSGLTIGHAKRGLEALGKGMTSETLNDVTYWSAPLKSRRVSGTAKQPAVHLLPNYDEYLNALKDRSLALDPLGAPPTLNSFIGVPHQLVIDGILRGAWRRVTTSRAVTIAVKTFRPLSKKERDSLAEAVTWHGEFLGLPATLTMA